jgi:hypothetical protein
VLDRLGARARLSYPARLGGGVCTNSHLSVTTTPSNWARRATVIYVIDGRKGAHRNSSFSDMERVKRAERKRRYRETSPGERLEGALQLSELAAELRSGRRTRSG